MYLFILGFLNTLLSSGVQCRKFKELTLLRLKKNGAIGAAYLGAKATDYILPLDYENNVDIFFHKELWIFHPHNIIFKN